MAHGIVTYPNASAQGANKKSCLSTPTSCVHIEQMCKPVDISSEKFEQYYAAYCYELFIKERDG